MPRLVFRNRLDPDAPEATGTWTDVTPGDFSLAPGTPPNEVYGAVGMSADPSRSGAAFCGGDKQGIWETTNAGLTWTKVYAAAGNFNGSPWSQVWAPSGSFGLSTNGYGSAVGLYRSTDRGRNWAQVVSDDINIVTMSPTDENHLLATSHGITEDWYESTDGGQNWTNLGNQTPGIWYDGRFLSDTVWIGVGPDGVWRGEKSGGSWGWTEVIAGVESPHGGAQVLRDADNDWFYVGVSTIGDLQRRIYRSSISGGGSSWAQVATLNSGYAVGTIWKSALRLYAHANVATQAFNDPSPYQALASAGDSWSSGPSTPAGMTNGAHSIAVVQNPAGQYVFLAACDLAGFWRYVAP